MLLLRKCKSHFIAFHSFVFYRYVFNDRFWANLINQRYIKIFLYSVKTSTIFIFCWCIFYLTLYFILYFIDILRVSISVIDFSAKLNKSEMHKNIFKASASLLIRFSIVDNAQLKSLESFILTERSITNYINKMIETPSSKSARCNGIVYQAPSRQIAMYTLLNCTRHILGLLVYTWTIQYEWRLISRQTLFLRRQTMKSGASAPE